jgi:hypothetical protein
MATPESAPRGGRFSTSGSTTVGNGALICNDLCVRGEDCSTIVGNGSWDNAHTSDPSSKGKRSGGKPSTLVQHRQCTGGSSGGWGPTPIRFSPHNVECKKVKDNMQLAFIEKLFTNREIETSVKTRYLRFKGMSYKSESYLCDISCVQLWKALVRFRCGNTQLEVVLGAWKSVPYVERLCQGCDLGKVKDEKHLLLVIPNTQKIREHFCLALPVTHTSILAELMQTTNTVALAKFVACCQYQRTICSPFSTFRLMDSLVPNGCKIVNSKHNQCIFASEEVL